MEYFLIFRDPIEEGSSIFLAQKDVPCWSTFLMYTLVFFLNKINKKEYTNFLKV
jgi:energy-coupling factor transporter transmembrane protein EcfT